MINCCKKIEIFTTKIYCIIYFMNKNITVNTDSYKLGHHLMMDSEIQYIFSYFD